MTTARAVIRYTYTDRAKLDQKILWSCYCIYSWHHKRKCDEVSDQEVSWTKEHIGDRSCFSLNNVKTQKQLPLSLLAVCRSCFYSVVQQHTPMSRTAIQSRILTNSTGTGQHNDRWTNRTTARVWRDPAYTNRSYLLSKEIQECWPKHHPAEHKDIRSSVYTGQHWYRSADIEMRALCDMLL